MEVIHVWPDAVWPWLSAWIQSPGILGIPALIIGCATYRFRSKAESKAERSARLAMDEALMRRSAGRADPAHTTSPDKKAVE